MEDNKIRIMVLLSLYDANERSQPTQTRTLASLTSLFNQIRNACWGQYKVKTSRLAVQRENQISLRLDRNYLFYKQISVFAFVGWNNGALLGRPSRSARNRTPPARGLQGAKSRLGHFQLGSAKRRELASVHRVAARLFRLRQSLARERGGGRPEQNRESNVLKHYLK